jgi:hypothetical protein
MGTGEKEKKLLCRKPVFKLVQPPLFAPPFPEGGWGACEMIPYYLCMRDCLSTGNTTLSHMGNATATGAKAKIAVALKEALIQSAHGFLQSKKNLREPEQDLFNHLNRFR